MLRSSSRIRRSLRTPSRSRCVDEPGSSPSPCRGWDKQCPDGRGAGNALARANVFDERMPAPEAFIGDVIMVRKDRWLEPFQGHRMSAKFAEQRRACLPFFGRLRYFTTPSPGSAKPIPPTARGYVRQRTDRECIYSRFFAQRSLWRKQQVPLPLLSRFPWNAPETSLPWFSGRGNAIILLRPYSLTGGRLGRRFHDHQ
jgi:hypothetical protein